MKHLLLFTLFLGLAASFASKPNVILILTDDQGWADVGYQGCTDIPTPAIDRLAAEGVVFSSGYVSAPYCSPSRAGLMTGRYQQRFGHEGNPDYDPENPILGTSLDETMLPSVLKTNGYQTVGIGKWHLGDHPQFAPEKRGFDHWFGFSGGGFNYYGIGRSDRGPDYGIFRNGVKIPPSKITHLTDDFSDEAVWFIEEKGDKPFFMYLAYNAPHAPNQATAEHLEKTKHIEYGPRSIYGAMVAGVDMGIARIIDALKEQGIYENTMIVFLSDNGGRGEVADNRPYRGYKGHMYEGGIRVPFLISWPGGLAPRKIDEPVISLDLFPTICAVTGTEIPDTLALDGKNLIQALENPASLSNRTLYWRTVGGDEWAIRRGDLKFVSSKYRGQQYLFNLSVDPGERHNLLEERPHRAKPFEKWYAAWSSELMDPLWYDPHEENRKKGDKLWKDTRDKALPPSKRK